MAMSTDILLALFVCLYTPLNDLQDTISKKLSELIIVRDFDIHLMDTKSSVSSGFLFIYDCRKYFTFYMYPILH